MRGQLMIKKANTALGLVTATLTLAGTLASPQVTAQTQAERVADAAAKKTAALEAQMNKMSVMMEAMQAELSRVKATTVDTASANEAKVLELDQWMASVKSAPAPSYSKDHMVFFRGGYAGNDSGREGSILTDANATNEGVGGNIAGLGLTTSSLTGNSPNGDQDAWYFGAGFEFNLTNDLFGFMDGTSVLGEVTLNYKEFDDSDLNRAPLGTAANDSASGAAGDLLGPGSVPSNGVVCSEGGLTTGGSGPYGSCSANVAVTQITLTAAPKIKFMHGSKLRPWIIPAGFGLHVISPPSDGVTVTAPGIFFGAGLDYQLFKNIHAGIDGRYHLVSNTLADVDLDGFEVGGYLGFGF